MQKIYIKSHKKSKFVTHVSTGEHCELCVEGYVRRGRDCVPCREICNNGSITCRDKTGANTRFLSLERVQCMDCANNTKGDFCETCLSHEFFYNTETLGCERCTCNGHAWTCDLKTGLDCPCQNHTFSSRKCGNEPNCRAAQCDKCDEGWEGDPRDGSACYEQLTNGKIYNFTGGYRVSLDERAFSYYRVAFPSDYDVILRVLLLCQYGYLGGGLEGLESAHFVVIWNFSI